MKMPTREQLDAIEVTDADLREWGSYVQRVEYALQRARIPMTLDWAMVMIRFASQSSATQGMPEQYFREICECCFAYASDDGFEHTRRLAASRRPPPLSPEELERTWRPRIIRMAKVCHDAGFPDAGAEVLHAHIMLSARIVASYGHPLELWMGIVASAWESAERAIIAASKANKA